MKLLDYIGGKRHGKAANRLEREAMEDPFLQDALDGFDAVGGDPGSDMELLRKRIRKRAARHPSFNRRKTFAIAASVTLLMVGISSLIYFLNKEEDLSTEALALQDTSSVQQSIDTDHLAVSGILSEEEAGSSETLKIVELEDGIHASDTETYSMESNHDSFQAKIIQNEAIALSLDADSDHSDLVSRKYQNMETGSIAMEISTSTAKEVVSQSRTSSVTEDSSGSIFGIIRDRSTNEFIPFANIALLSGDSIVSRTQADFNGNYALRSIRPGTYNLHISCMGYQSMEITEITVASERTLSNNIVLDPSQEELASVEIVAHKVPVFEADQTSSASVIMEEDMSQLQDYPVQGVFSRDGEIGNIRGLNNISVFGETDFKNYFKRNYHKDICSGNKANVVLSFYVDENGMPTDIKVGKSSCDELREEALRLLKEGPAWTSTKRNVKIEIRIK